jgi:2-aminoethylphosphonate aminotransferase
MMQIQRNILLNPGPATTTDTVKLAMVVPDICPREKEFCNLVREIRADLVRIAKGDGGYTAILFTGSGTAVMDAALNSVVPPGQKIAIINNGAYGERLVKIAQAYHLDLVEMKLEYGEKINPQKVAGLLQNDPQITCLAMIHHETTTGLLNPIREIGAIAKQYGCVFIVDTISSFAGIPIDIKECNIDFMMSTSNKCIQGMAGVAFIICKKSELEKLKDYPPRSYYLNLYNQYRYFETTGQSQFTPAVQILYALKQAISEYFAEGGEARYQRYTENWRVLRQGLLDLGFKLFHAAEDESHILLTVNDPEDSKYNFEAMHDYLYRRGYTIYPGKIGNKNTFRLANMGAITPEDIQGFINVLKAYLVEAGITLK